MDTPTTTRSTRLPTPSEMQLLNWFTDQMAVAMKPIVKALEDRLDVLESENISMRRALSTKATGTGVRRRITEDLGEDPKAPGSSLLRLSNGDLLSVPDERRTTLATRTPAGRA